MVLKEAAGERNWHAVRSGLPGELRCKAVRYPYIIDPNFLKDGVSGGGVCQAVKNF